LLWLKELSTCNYLNREKDVIVEFLHKILGRRIRDYSSRERGSGDSIKQREGGEETSLVYQDCAETGKREKSRESLTFLRPSKGREERACQGKRSKKKRPGPSIKNRERPCTRKQMRPVSARTKGGSANL